MSLSAWMLACHSQFLLSRTPVAVLLHAYLVFLYSAVSCWDCIALVRHVGGIILTGEKQSTQTETRPSAIFFHHIGLGLNSGPPRRLAA